MDRFGAAAITVLCVGSMLYYMIIFLGRRR